MSPSHIVILLILVLVAGVNPLPAWASELQATGSSLQPIAPDDREPMLVPGASKFDYSCLSMGEMISMIAGAVVGGAAADLVLRSAPFAVVGIAAGAAIGSLLYRYSL